MKRLTATLREQQAEAAKLDTVIVANLKELGYGGCCLLRRRLRACCRSRMAAQALNEPTACRIRSTVRTVLLGTLPKP